jgi:hypothetical protein
VKKDFLVLGFFIWTGLVSMCRADEQVTLTTYYPAPFGVYKELAAQRMKIGTTYSSVVVADDNLIVEGGVGIGTRTPVNRLDIAGAEVVGRAYAGVNTAPPNGLLVQGNVGIGTIIPSEKLEVNGGIKFTISAPRRGPDTEDYFKCDDNEYLCGFDCTGNCGSDHMEGICCRFY